MLLGFDGEDVAADGFGFLGLVEVAVQLDLGDGFGNACFGDGLQLVLHGASLGGLRVALRKLDGRCGSLETPEEIAGDDRAQNCAAVAAGGDDFVEVLDLQAVVEGVANAMGGVEKRERAKQEKVEAHDWKREEGGGTCIVCGFCQAERSSNSQDEEVDGDEEGGDDTPRAEEEPQERFDAKFGWLSVHLVFYPLILAGAAKRSPRK